MFNVAFRVDASDTIGSGHIMRCLTLAEKLRLSGIKSTFICARNSNNLVDLIEQKGFAVQQILNCTDAMIFGTKRQNFANNNWQRDAEETALILKQSKFHWLVVDHYNLDVKWEVIQKPHVDKIMVIDDLANREHEADVLLDQNLYPNMSERYDHKVNKNCQKLLGLDYALLQPEYATFRDKLIIPKKKVQRIFMYFGNGNTNFLATRFVDSFINISRSEINLDIVLAYQSTERDQIEKKSQQNQKIVVHEPRGSLASLMSRADVAIGAGGATSWERICLGLPSIVVTVADNQYECAQHTNKLGLINLIGDSATISDKKIKSELIKLLDTPSLAAWSQKCFDRFEGLGATKVAKIMVESI